MAEETDGERLLRLFGKLKREEHMSRSAFARKYQIPGGDSMIYQHIAGLKPISLEAGLAYARGFGCSLATISPRLAGEAAAITRNTLGMGTVSLDDPKATSTVGIRLPTLPDNKIPVVGTAQLGDDGFWAEMDYPVGHGDGSVRHYTDDGNAYALRCKGLSMMPRIRDGEFVIVEPNTTPRPGDDVLVKHVDGRVMVKRFLYERDGMIHLESINAAFPAHDFALEDIETFHFVRGIAMRSCWVPD